MGSAARTKPGGRPGSGNRAPEQGNARQKPAERRAAEHRAAEHRAAEHRAAEHRAAEHRAAEHRAAEHRAAEHRAAEHRAAEHRAAEHRAAEHRAAEHRAAEHRAQARRRLLLAGGSVAAVIALVVALIVVKLSQSPAHGAPPARASVTAQVQREVTSVPASAFNAVGAGSASGFSSVTGQPALTSSGKPELLYMGGEYCPYCAAERWALAAAVSRFGTLSGLTLVHSSPSDVYASTPTLSFAKASYTSKYLAFDPVEWFGEGTDPSTPFGHVYLEQPTAQQQALFTRYASGAIPFVDIGNRYILPQVQYAPSDLDGMTWTQIAAAMRDPSSTQAKDIDGAANVITAHICTMTNGQPGSVCHSAGVQAAGKS